VLAKQPHVQLLSLHEILSLVAEDCRGPCRGFDVRLIAHEPAAHGGEFVFRKLRVIGRVMMGPGYRDGASIARSDAYRLVSRSWLTGTAGGNMLSYIARASRIRRARSRSDFAMNRTTSPNVRSMQGRYVSGDANIMPSRAAPFMKKPSRGTERRRDDGPLTHSVTTRRS
jgi:hypothetical protein